MIVASVAASEASPAGSRLEARRYCPVRAGGTGGDTAAGGSGRATGVTGARGTQQPEEPPRRPQDPDPPKPPQPTAACTDPSRWVGQPVGATCGCATDWDGNRVPMVIVSSSDLVAFASAQRQRRIVRACSTDAVEGTPSYTLSDGPRACQPGPIRAAGLASRPAPRPRRDGALLPRSGAPGFPP